MESTLKIIPFNLIDFFAYLGIGYGFIVSMAALSTPWLRDLHGKTALVDSPLLANPVVSVPLIIVASYVMGHVLSQLTYLTVDRVLVAKLFGSARTFSLAELVVPRPSLSRPSKFALAALGASSFTSSLSPEITRRVAQRYRSTTKMAFSPSRESEVQCALIVSATNTPANDRLRTFHAIRIFCRNTSASLFIIGLTLAIHGGLGNFLLCFILLAGSWLLLGRYLLFLKFHTDETYIAFSAGRVGKELEGKDKDGGTSS